MASEPIGVEVELNGATEKQRFAEHKVYTRKAFRGSRNKPTINTSTEINAIPTPARAVADAAAASANDTKNGEENDNITSVTLTSNFNLDSNSCKAPQPVAKDVNLTMVQPVSMSVVVSDDSSSLNHQQVAGPMPQDLPSGNGLINTGVEGQTMVNSSLKSKQDMLVFRHKLETELGIIRSWVKRIDEKQGKLSGYGHSHASEGANGNAASNPSRSEVASVGVPRKVSRPLHHLRVSVFDHSHGLSDSLEKEKRTPKANQFYRNSEFLLAKDKFPPAESNKKSKLNGKKQSGELGLAHGMMVSKFFKSCSSLLEKLMKHKHAWVFNTPVDVEDLGLHDYYIIIKRPMDLGTVKTRLTKNWYKSPKEFAEDIRLTFRNAMTYNPKGQDVHVMAEQLSKIFEERWVIIESDYNREMKLGLDYGVSLSTPTSRKAHLHRPPPLDMRRIFDRSESVTHPVDSIQKAITVTPSSRTPAPKKPKAKDPHKRDMTYEEKQKLSTKLQSLPSERLDAVVQIIKKRNSALFQHDEEIEVDIDSVDAETLWELDRFVTNYKKSLSKKKRKAELAIQASQARANTEHKVQGKTMAPAVADAPKENKADENAVSSVSPFQGKKQADDRSRSSSSSSSSSDSETSSSDSDSESSSASGSDIGAPTN